MTVCNEKIELCEQKSSETLTVINPLPGFSVNCVLTWQSFCAPSV